MRLLTIAKMNLTFERKDKETNRNESNRIEPKPNQIKAYQLINNKDLALVWQQHTKIWQKRYDCVQLKTTVCLPVSLL